jgi:hypothetical protein
LSLSDARQKVPVIQLGRFVLPLMLMPYNIFYCLFIMPYDVPFVCLVCFSCGSNWFPDAKDLAHSCVSHFLNSQQHGCQIIAKETKKCRQY